MKSNKTIGDHNVEILIAENIPEEAYKLKNLLEKENCNTYVCESELEVFSFLEGNKADLIIISNKISGINGLELSKKLKLNEKSKKTPVMIITGLYDSLDNDECMDCNADIFISTPINEEIFLDWVEYLISLNENKMQNINDLEHEIADVQIHLAGESETSVPFCIECKKIKKDQGNWQQIDEYLEEISAMQFTHGYCPECSGKVLSAINNDFIQSFS